MCMLRSKILMIKLYTLLVIDINLDFKPFYIISHLFYLFMVFQNKPKVFFLNLSDKSWDGGGHHPIQNVI